MRAVNGSDQTWISGVDARDRLGISELDNKRFTAMTAAQMGGYGNHYMYRRQEVEAVVHLREVCGISHLAAVKVMVAFRDGKVALPW